MGFFQSILNLKLNVHIDIKFTIASYKKKCVYEIDIMNNIRWILSWVQQSECSWALTKNCVVGIGDFGERLLAPSAEHASEVYRNGTILYKSHNIIF